MHSRVYNFLDDIKLSFTVFNNGTVVVKNKIQNFILRVTKLQSQQFVGLFSCRSQGIS